MAILIMNKGTRAIHVRKPGRFQTLCGLKNSNVPKNSYTNLQDTAENRKLIKCNACSIVNNEFFG